MNGWWIVFILMVWALLVLIAGIVFIVWRAFRAMRLLKNLKEHLSDISHDISVIKNTLRGYDELALSVPLRETSTAYSNTYEEILKKRENRARIYKTIWDTWNKQEPTSSTDMKSLQDLIQKVDVNNGSYVGEDNNK